MEPAFKNKNRGYQQLRVWEDAVALYVMTCRAFRSFPFELKKVASQQIASTDSVHRNIAEGYCRRSIKEYLQFLNFSLGSIGESVSGLIAYHRAEQISETSFSEMNAMAYKLEYGLLKLVESLERKKEAGDWIDHLVLKESNLIYSTGPEQIVIP